MTALKQEQLFDEIDVLPIDLKTKIVDKILNGINPIDKSMDDLWIKEVNKRKDEIESSKVTLVSADMDEYKASNPRENWKKNIKEVLEKNKDKKDEGVISELLDDSDLEDSNLDTTSSSLSQTKSKR